MRHSRREKRPDIPRGLALNLLASALTILSAVVLLVTSEVVGGASVVAPGAHPEKEIIRDFYSAVNEALRTGDLAALDRVVSPDLVFNTSSPRIAPNRMGLEHYLTDLRANFPDFQIQVQDIVGDGNQAMAQVTGGSSEPGGFLGLGFAALPRVWGPFDVFRVENSQIIAVEMTAPSPVVLEPTVRVPLDAHLEPPVLSLERLSASSGEGGEWGPFFGPRVLYVDEGTITVDVDPTWPPALVYAKRNDRLEPPATVLGTPVTLTAGDAVSFPLGSRYEFQHDATDGDAVAFAVALPQFSYEGPLQPQTPSSIVANAAKTRETVGLRPVRTALVGGPVPEMFSDAAVSFGRAVMAPGADIAFHETEGYTFVAVEAGTLALLVEHDATVLERVDSGAASVVMPGAPFSLHNLGSTPATAILVTMLPRNALNTPPS